MLWVLYRYWGPANQFNLELFPNGGGSERLKFYDMVVKLCKKGFRL